MLVTDHRDITGHQGACRKYSGHSGPESGEGVLPHLTSLDRIRERLSVQRGRSLDQISGQIGGFLSGFHAQVLAACCLPCNSNIWNVAQHERWHRYGDT